MFDKLMHTTNSSLDASFHDQTKGQLSRGGRSRQGQRRRTSLDNSDLTGGNHNESSLLQILRRNDVNGYEYGDDGDYMGGSTHKYYSMGISKYTSNHSSNLSTDDDLDDDELPRKRRHSLNYGITVPTTFLADLIPSKPKGDLDDDCHAGVGRPTNSPTKRSTPQRDVNSPKKVPGRSHSTPLTVMANSLIASPIKGAVKSTVKTPLKRTPVSPRKSPRKDKAPVMKARHTFDSDDESDSSWVPDDDSFGEAADQEQACLAYIQQDLGASYYFDDEEFFNHHVKPHVVEDDTASLDEVLEELVEEEEIEEELKPSPPPAMDVLPSSVVVPLPAHGSSHHGGNDDDDDSDCDSFGEANEMEQADKEYLQKDLGASCFWGEECPALDMNDGGVGTACETFMTIGEEDEDDDSTDDVKKIDREEQPQDDGNEEAYCDPIKPVLEETAPSEQAPTRRRSRNILRKFMPGKKK